MVKNPANAADMCSIPGPGRSHVPQRNYGCEPQPWSLCSTAWGPQLLSPCSATTEAWGPWGPRSITREADATRRPGTTTRECALLTATRAHLCSSKDPAQPPPKKRACERTAEAHAVLCLPVQWPEQWALQASLQGNCGVGSELACPPVE